MGKKYHKVDPKEVNASNKELPNFVKKFRGRFAFDGSVAGIWKLCGRVVTPDDDVLDVLDGHPALAGDLGHGSILSRNFSV